MPSRNKNRVKNPDGTWSKRPVKPQIVKRKEVEDGDGWTHVIGPHQHKIRDSIDTNVIHIERNLDEMLAQHERALKRWQESETSKTLSTKVLEFEEHPSIKIKKIVCLGLGTLQNGNFTQQNNRHAQLAVLMDLVDTIGGSSQLTMLAQDPAFGPCDKSFLGSLGFQVVDDPSAFEAIDGETLVYAVHCHEDVYETVTKLDRPAILIGNDLEELCNSIDPSKWLKPFADDYKESSSVEPVLSKRKERTDHFDQIFYSALYATRFYLRNSPKLQMPLQDLPLLANESSQVDVNDSTVTSEEQAVEEILDETLEEILEEIQPLQDNLEIARERNPEYSIAPTPEVLRENFKIFEDQKRLIEEVDQPMQEGDPAIENKENLPPDESQLVTEHSSDDNRRYSQELFSNRRSSINFLPGLRLSALPTFEQRNNEGFGFIFARNIANSSPAS